MLRLTRTRHIVTHLKRWIIYAADSLRWSTNTLKWYDVATMSDVYSQVTPPPQAGLIGFSNVLEYNKKYGFVSTVFFYTLRIGFCIYLHSLRLSCIIFMFTFGVIHLMLALAISNVVKHRINHSINHNE